MKPTVVAVVSLLALGSIAFASGPKKLKQPGTLPLVISQPGSYVLAGNFTVPDANTTAISITADNVTLDLGGFSIIGPTSCSGGPPVTGCAPTGSGNGIDGPGANDVTVTNGSIKGMGNTAIVLGQRARVERVRAVSNGAAAFPNAAIFAGSESILIGNTVVNNGGSGIFCYGDSVSGNVAKGNNGDGIDCGNQCIVTGNTSSHNAGSGIGAGASAVVSNTLIANGASGLNVFGGEVGYTNNVIQVNGFGNVTGGGEDMGNNDCNFSTTCP